MPATWLLTVLVVLAAPVALPALALIDLVKGRRGLPLARGWLFGSAYGLLESGMLLVVVATWLATGCGAAMNRPWSQRLHGRLQAWWTRKLLVLLRALLGLRFSLENAEAVSPGPVIVFGRHVSLVDTLFPALALIDSNLSLRYVLKRELEVMPLLDIVGHRLPNYFADRSGTDTAAELAALSELGTGLGASDSVVIFPEGTRGTPDKRKRAVERLGQEHPELAERASAFRHTMPPRWGGAFALLDAAPTADVVVFVHHGLDGLHGLGTILAAVPFRRPVSVELWRIPRSEIPERRGERRLWLFDLWAAIDDWVDDREREQGGTATVAGPAER